MLGDLQSNLGSEYECLSNRSPLIQDLGRWSLTWPGQHRALLNLRSLQTFFLSYHAIDPLGGFSFALSVTHTTDKFSPKISF